MAAKNSLAIFTQAARMLAESHHYRASQRTQKHGADRGGLGTALE